ncbi:MAG TPA: choice-of-anchor tandem repeat GloVer-containing protein [Rhizomicrobium sp.]|nr:choice-of-anchor tandem repeat GloVer-containing protein [Rhizomicrobium sp.]
MHEFGGSGDGIEPYGGVVADAGGNIYGTTAEGGANGAGTVFELSASNGQWTETVLYSFCAETYCADGAYPFAGLVLDVAGNLYGTTDSGVTGNECVAGSTCGTVFELASVDGQWAETVLHSFEGSDGATPTANVIFDAAGNLYGTAYLGGSNACSMGCGAVFELKPGKGGACTEKTLHLFENARDGANPCGGLVPDSSGNFYGTTSQGPGTDCDGLGCGAVYSIRPRGKYNSDPKVVTVHGHRS